ncbi:MAG TPA: hypothetical protein VJZ26_15800 [Blastocatellia bacterium]|nr:hypothetical protein [Blastocatellia bacterium]
MRTIREVTSTDRVGRRAKAFSVATLEALTFLVMAPPATTRKNRPYDSRPLNNTNLKIIFKKPIIWLLAFFVKFFFGRPVSGGGV